MTFEVSNVSQNNVQTEQQIAQSQINMLKMCFSIFASIVSERLSYFFCNFAKLHFTKETLELVEKFCFDILELVG